MGRLGTSAALGAGAAVAGMAARGPLPRRHAIPRTVVDGRTEALGGGPGRRHAPAVNVSGMSSASPSPPAVEALDRGPALPEGGGAGLGRAGG